MSREKLLAKRVREYILKNKMVSPGDTVLVGVSGGQDSVCLLSILQELKLQLKIKLHVAHLNHLLRGQESDADAAYVRELAQHWNLPVTVARVNVADYCKKHHLSLEEAAREVRYHFFARVAQEAGADKIAVGHTTGDQVETILMHLIRGSGMDGMRGMLPDTSLESSLDKTLRLIRPLLDVTREETEAYCRFNKLVVREDPSNVLPDYMRNGIRHQLLPLLRSYNKGFNDGLLRTAYLVTQDMAFLTEYIAGLWDDIVHAEDRALIIDTKRLRSLHPALQYRICREILRQLAGSAKDIELRHIDSMVKALSLSPGKVLSLPQGLKLAVGYNQWFIGPNLKTWCPFPPLNEGYELTVPGEIEIPGWHVVATRQGKTKNLPAGWEAKFDYHTVGSKLHIRSRRDGDVFQPLGMAQMKKIQDFMVDARISRLWRERIPLVCSPQQIIWVAGWRIDERVKVKMETTEILHLEFIPLDNPKI